MRKFGVHSISLFLLFLGLYTSPALADTLTGEVRGTVLDVEGRLPLAGVTMTLVNVDRGWTRAVPSDVNGNYVFIQLEPGNYTVRAEIEGYYQSERTDVLIRLNRPKVVIPPFELRKLVATPTQQITLRGEQTRTAIIDLTAPGPNPTVLAFLNEPGLTSMVSLGDWALRANYEASLVHLLPLRGTRTFDQLALLSPGVFRVPFSSGQGPAVGVGVGTTGQFSVNGLRGRSNNFTVDGSDNNDEDIGVRRQGFVALTPQSIESVEEFQVVTAGFPAEFGRNSGSMVNAVSRSGQNEVHGAVYGLFNDDALNARDFFEHEFADTTNVGKLNGGRFTGKDFNSKQFGGVLGGPVIPDKLFYFVSAERQDHKGTRLRHFVVPANEERGLRVKDGFIPIDELDDFFAEREIGYSNLAGQGVFDLYPLPNNLAGPFGTHNYSQVKKGQGEGFIFSARQDWYLSSVHSFFSRYNFTGDESIIPFTSEAIDSSLGTDTRTQNISLFLNSTTPGYGNALRVSYGRTRLSFPPESGSPLLFGSAPSEALPPEFATTIETSYGRFGPFGSTGPIGQLSIVPYSTIGIDVFNFPQGRVDNTFQFSDFFTWTGVEHTVKFGFDIRRSQLNSFSDRNARPLVTFGHGFVSSGCVQNPFCPFATSDGVLRGTDLAALGAPAFIQQTISTEPVPDSTIGLRFTQYDFFIQDDWRVTPNFTLNLGLRYELQTAPREVNRRIENTFDVLSEQFGHLEPSGSLHDQSIITAGNQAFDRSLNAYKAFLKSRNSIYNTDKNNFSPRFGFSWDPWGKGKTVIRGGYSRSYDVTLGAVTSQSRNVFPTFLVSLGISPNFAPPTGFVLATPNLFTFVPLDMRLIRPGTLNTYNLPDSAFATGLGALLVQAPAFPGAPLSSNGLAFTLPERDLETSSSQHFVLSAQQQLGNTVLVSVNYVGSRGSHLTRLGTPNGGGSVTTPVLFFPFVGSIGILDIPPSPDVTRLGRPIPELGAFTLFENSMSSTYHSLQFSVEKRLSHDFQFRADWTWAHAIDEVSDPFDGRGFFSRPQDGLRLDLERASASFDARHRVAGFATWALPSAGRNVLLRDWILAAVAEFQTGQPFTVNTSLDRNFDGNLTDRLDTVQRVVIDPGNPHSVRLRPATAALDLVAPRGSTARVGRNTFRAHGIATIDAALSKRILLGEETSLDLRLEIFNLLNRTHFGIPVRILESPGFGRSFDTQMPPRSIRWGIQFSF